MSQVLLVTLAAAVLVSQTAGQQPRDTPPAAGRTGTAAIRGRVTGAEGGQPVRRAVVTLMAMLPPGTSPPVPTGPVSAGAAAARAEAAGMANRPRSVVTDASGRFEFTGLTPGSYRLRASPSWNSGQYLAAAYGGKDSMDPGRAIELRDGEQFERADFALRRGGAIVGRIIDDSGEPLSRVNVQPMRIMPGTGSLQRGGPGMIQSDDHGRYRIFGLEPGEYLVLAEARGMSGPMVEGSEQEGFVPTYHSSTPHEREGTRVRVRAAADVEAVDIQMIRTRTFRISGTVMDSRGQPVQRPNPMLVRAGTDGTSGGGFGVDQQGRFTLRDVVPGEYTLIIRSGMFGDPQGPGSQQQPPREYAAVPLSVNADVENLVVVTQPGVSVTGRITFADGHPPGEVNGVRVMAMPVSRMPMFGPPSSAVTGADGQFTLSDMFGPLRLNVSLRREWAIKAIMLGATDVTDTAVEFKPEHSGHLEIVVATRTAVIEGTVTSDDGAPAEQAMIMVMPEDKESWRAGSPRIRTTISGKDGKFATGGLVAGRYLAVALPSRSVVMMPDTRVEFFESLAKIATRVVVAEEEKRAVDLRLSTPPQ